MVDHCPLVPTWTEAIGYLLYAAEFPTSMDISDLIKAINVLFPRKVMWEWQEFDYFRGNLVSTKNKIKKIMEPETAQRIVDGLYFEFSQKIAAWLKRGIVELDDNRTPEQIAERANKEINKKIQSPRKPLSERKCRYEINEKPDGTRSVTVLHVRYCLGCGEMLTHQTKYRFCNDYCRDKFYGKYDQEVLLKYFPNAHINGT